MHMFAYILKAHTPASAQIEELFTRFKSTPGLLHAYNLQGTADTEDAVAVAIWENREAAEAYLQKSQLKRDVDKILPGAVRTMYEVIDSK